MKNLLYIGIILILASCGLNEVERGSSVNVNGREVSTVKIGPDAEGQYLEVMTEDLGKMNWDEANRTCADLGDGWRLPSKDELNILYIRKNQIGGFTSNGYWTHTGIGGGSPYKWVRSFSDGNQLITHDMAYVRALRILPIRK